MVDFISNLSLIDLHIHVGGSVAPHVLWRLAHEQGFKLPVDNYWQFKQLVTATSENVSSLDDYLKILHEWTEKIQSSPMAVEQSVYEIISKEYRSSNVTAMELRFNPMKRNSGGELDLDHIIHAALRGMDRVCLEYGVQAGLIFCLAREFDFERNKILVEKAIRYHGRGVVGIDLAGTEKRRLEDDPALLKSYGELFAYARQHGLKTTVHTGETRVTSGEAVIAVLKHLKPHRIGHGIRAAYNPKAMAMLREQAVTLEICPTCNLRTGAVANMQEFQQIFTNFNQNGVRYTINTDGSYLLQTNMQQELRLLHENRILSQEQIEQSLLWAKEACFIFALRYNPNSYLTPSHQAEEE